MLYKWYYKTTQLESNPKRRQLGGAELFSSQSVNAKIAIGCRDFLKTIGWAKNWINVANVLAVSQRLNLLPNVKALAYLGNGL